jgi:2-polyprenyl-6-hydroxyphenyl methylase/3-demethylubiquinone-9 3-methyltransferase
MTGRMKSERGMALWYDLKDWLGGYPFEVATPQSLVEFYRDRGYALVKFKPCADPRGNNEFVFRSARGPSPSKPVAGT